MSLMTLLMLLGTAFSSSAGSERPDKIDKPTILWAFSSAGDKNPSVQSSLITSRHELFRLYYHGLKNYSHSVFVGSMPKIEHELQQKKLVCFPGSSEFQRRREFSYLTAQYIQPSPKIVMKKHTANQLLSFGNSTLKLAAVVSNKTLKGVVGQGRSFGFTIDEALLKSKGTVKFSVFETFRDTALQMIEQGNADYTIEYQFIFDSLAHNNPKYADLVTISLSDVEPTMTQYLACSKTPAGLDVITQADALIRENIRKPSYWMGVLDSVGVKDRPQFQKQIDQYIEERTKAPVIIK